MLLPLLVTLDAAAGQQVLDDWRPGGGDEWWDASRQGWVYSHDNAPADASTAHNRASGHELVVQTLSDACGTFPP